MTDLTETEALGRIVQVFQHPAVTEISIKVAGDFDRNLFKTGQLVKMVAESDEANQDLEEPPGVD